MVNVEMLMKSEILLFDNNGYWVLVMTNCLVLLELMNDE